MKTRYRIISAGLALAAVLGLASCREVGMVDGLILGAWKLKSIEYVGILPPASIPTDIEYLFTEEPAQVIITTNFRQGLPITKIVETATFVTDEQADPKTLDVLVIEECITNGGGSETCIPILGGILDKLFYYEYTDENNTLTLYGMFDDPAVRPESVEAAQVVIILERVVL